jgi:cation:H+ antiporter
MVLTTLAFALVGVTVLLSRRKRRQGRVVVLDADKVRADLLWFLGIFTTAVVAGELPHGNLRVLVAAGLVLAWLLYVIRSLRWAEQQETQLQPLHFHRSQPLSPERWRVFAQVLLGVAGMMLGAQLFVSSLLNLSAGVRLSATLLALLLSPIGTELPEMVNTVLWVRRGDEALAVGNLSGAMLVQAAIPCALGLIFTNWSLTGAAFWSVFFTLLAALWLRWRMRATPGWQVWELLVSLGFYAAFLFTVRQGG